MTTLTYVVRLLCVGVIAYAAYAVIGAAFTLWHLRKPIREDRADLRRRRAFVEAMTEDPERWK